MSTALWLFALGIAVGIGAAYVVSALRRGLTARAVIGISLVVAALAYLGWMAFMVLGVGPSLR